MTADRIVRLKGVVLGAACGVAVSIWIHPVTTDSVMKSCVAMMGLVAAYGAIGLVWPDEGRRE